MSSITTRSWPEIRAVFEDHVRSGIKNDPILDLIEWIEDQHLTTELYASTKHADLILGTSQIFPDYEHMLSIGWNNPRQVYNFQYFKRGAHPEMERTVQQNDGRETLRLMLAYKFGLHRQPAA